MASTPKATAVAADPAPRVTPATASGTRGGQPLEPSPEQMRWMLERAGERIVDHIASLPEQPASDRTGLAEAMQLVTGEAPEAGRPYEELLDLLFDRLIPKGLNTASPGYLAYIPGGGLFESAVATLIASAVNRYVGVGHAAPALARLEATVIEWFCSWVGYPKTASGFLASGGSLANLTAIVTARKERLPASFLHGTLYASDQVHHSVTKAATLAGFPPENVRLVGTDRRYRIRRDRLTAAIRGDRAAGLTPFLVVGSAGTTNTGAVDDLEALAEVATAENLWLHVDAAYGGFFVLTERGARTLAGLEAADSITLDPHKSLFLPYGTGCLLVRDGAALGRTHAASADYLPARRGKLDVPHLDQISPELSRDFRGLRVWLPIELYGLGAFRDALDEKLDLARWAARELAAIEPIEMVAEPELSLLAFRLRPPGLGQRELNRLNRAFLDAINARQRVFVTATTVGGKYALRFCVLSFRTHREQMERAIEDVEAAAAEVLATARASAAGPATAGGAAAGASGSKR